MKYRLIFIGFGLVGQGLTEILINKRHWLKEKYNFECEIVAVSAKSKGAVADEKGLSAEKLLELVHQGKSLEEYPDGVKGLSPLQTIEQLEADILIEVTYTNIKTGEPATTYCRRALEKGMHVVTTNKGPAALFYRDLKKLADAKNVIFGIEGTVMSGTPVINTGLFSLAGCTIRKVRGILNGTTNYILTEMEQGKPYEEVLKKAQELGYAEADPAADVEGWDALAKIVILANVIMGQPLKTTDVVREGITKISLEDIEKARRENSRWKLIGEVSAENGKVKAKVGPEKLDLSDPLSSVMGTTNAITFDTDLMGSVTIVGAGAGRIETGFSLLTDILAIHRKFAG
ncbi:MAG: homoserine dehydrogenase [Calditrichaeota bacterium]|nr:homoserine dehydrogenase [Calditrichota bacterium]